VGFEDVGERGGKSRADRCQLQGDTQCFCLSDDAAIVPSVVVVAVAGKLFRVREYSC
jgi:hypothetical protein